MMWSIKRQPPLLSGSFLDTHFRLSKLGNPDPFLKNSRLEGDSNSLPLARYASLSDVIVVVVVEEEDDDGGGDPWLLNCLLQAAK